jgi:uncharacterized protein
MGNSAGGPAEAAAMAENKSQGQDKAGSGGHASAEGQKGVSQETVGSGKEKDPNNFANNPERASEAGRKGGKSSHKND